MDLSGLEMDGHIIVRKDIPNGYSELYTCVK